MPRSKSESYLHLVWTTRGREPLVTGRLGRLIKACIDKEVARCNGRLIAVGGLADHLHVLLRLPPVVAPAVLAKQLKGASSHLVNHHDGENYHDGEGRSDRQRFRWQEGYGVFSVSPQDVPRVAHHVNIQSRCHAQGEVWPEWEETEEESVERKAAT